MAWLDDALPGLTVEPKASQARHAALVVAHLDAGREELPRPDVGTRAEVEAPPAPGGTGFSPVNGESTGKTPGVGLAVVLSSRATVQLSPQQLAELLGGRTSKSQWHTTEITHQTMISRAP